ncbi:putative enzyme related to lactoylglutathione lyase [Gemmobacter caeni]|uniref:Putative enzyme related to lactoylglutathione lyase n=1 Tax=Gemmobacter caeni TaxID=589035 RepID=A0A2T6BBM3_9RHOB|nr:VOC family protein [Gemmobacter caeni]PTX53475.1 putative enzyme related to lactoylglutathione lyase [Gemmobacter caeni]TWJ05586.1 putative enzyme related to lactoylglutathione lyase [Gemmobacter caeni]
MIFRYTILYVQDVPATLDFYTRAFGLERGFLHDSGDYGEVQTGETRLAFSSVALMQRLGKRIATGAPALPAFEIAFETADVAAALERAVAAGAEQVQGVERMEWGQTTAYVRTPDGTLVELCTKVG